VEPNYQIGGQTKIADRRGIKFRAMIFLKRLPAFATLIYKFFQETVSSRLPLSGVEDEENFCRRF